MERAPSSSSPSSPGAHFAASTKVAKSFLYTCADSILHLHNFAIFTILIIQSSINVAQEIF
jgi:hypothetical protein